MTNNKLKKILIIGNGGSGKTTLSLKLSKIFNYPTLHLDSIYWVNGWGKNSLGKFEEHTHNFMDSNFWIIEGTPMHDIQFRLDQADTIIFLDINRVTCILRLIKRALKNIFHFRGQKIEGPANFFSLKAAIWVWKFNGSKRNTINTLLNSEKHKNIFYIENNSDLRNFINNLQLENKNPIQNYA